MPKFYVVGGRAKEGAAQLEEWSGYKEAVVLALDSDTGEARTVVNWTSPPEACPNHEPSFVFKAATLAQNELWLCTQTEVMCYSVPDFRRLHYISLPLFNDIHHVRPTARGTILVAVTGLDMVVELSRKGELLHEWGSNGEALWTRFSRNVDYRKVPTTQPHITHVNYVFEAEGETWATRCKFKDAVCLTDKQRRMAVDAGLLHDGHVLGHKVLFTVVDGRLAVYNRQKQSVQEVIDLNSVFNLPDGRPLGWCRGLEILSADQVVVGFSRLRQTKIRESLIWLKERVKDLAPNSSSPWYPLPTHVACIDLKRQAVEWDIDVEAHGLNAVFSIHACANGSH